MDKVRFGVTYSEREDFSDLVEYATMVEELGFDSLWITENIASDADALEVFTALSFMAAHTKQLTIGTSVLLLPLRNPVLVAQTVTSLDLLSEGRFVLGVGVGGPGGVGSDELDFEAYGVNVHERGARCDESLEVLKKIWTESSVSHKGRYYQLADYTLLPRPHQKPHPPIWVGGHAEGALRRAARWGDAYVPAPGTPEVVTQLYEKVESYAQEYGRAPSDIERSLHLYLCLSDDPAEAARISGEVLTKNYQEPISFSPDDRYLFGPPDRCRKVLQEYVDVGVTHFVFNTTGYPKEVVSQLEVVAREVLAPFR